MKNKKLIIIGNSPNVLNNDFGNQIDEFDVVIRLNNFETEKYSSKIGKKTDFVLITYDTKHSKELLKIPYDNIFLSTAGKNGDIQFLKQRMLGKNGCKISPTNINILSSKYFDDLNKKIGLSKNMQASTGMIAMEWAISNFKDYNIYIYGINFFKNDVNNNFDRITHVDKLHSFKLEEQYFQNVLSSRINIFNEPSKIDYTDEIKLNVIKHDINVIKHAIVTVTNDSFVKGSIVLIQSFLKQNNWFKGDIIVMYSKKIAKLSNDNKKILKSLSKLVILHEINEHEYNKILNNFKKIKGIHERIYPSIFTFETFSFNKYNKIVFLDSDMLITGDMKYVFEHPHPFCVTPDTTKVIDQEKVGKYLHRMFNGGFFAISGEYLNKKNDLIKFSENVNPRSMKYFDQSIMSEFFKGDEMTYVSTKYNTLKRSLSDNLFDFDKLAKVKNLHFVGSNPWEIKKIKPFEQNFKKIEKIWNDEYSYFEISKYLKNGISVIGSGNSLIELKNKEINLINNFPIFRSNWFFEDKITKISKNIFGFFFTINEFNLIDKFKKSNATTQFSFTIGKYIKDINNSFNFWKFLDFIPISKKHLQPKHKRDGCNLPTTGLQMLIFAASFKPKKIIIAGLDFYQNDVNKKIKGIGSQYDNENPYLSSKKPHDLKTDYLFLIESIKHATNTKFEVLGNEKLSAIIENIQENVNLSSNEILKKIM